MNHQHSIQQESADRSARREGHQHFVPAERHDVSSIRVGGIDRPQSFVQERGDQPKYEDRFGKNA